MNNAKQRGSSSKMQLSRRFKAIEHSSDVGINAYGNNLREVFENAAFGMFSLMANLDNVTPREEIKVNVEADDREELLINWLNELIYLTDAKKILFSEFKINNLEEGALNATIKGEMINPEEHNLYRPIKAATYNQLFLSAKKAEVVFDV